MNIVKPGFEVITDLSNEYATDKIINNIERIARTCYKSEDKITEDSAEKLIKNLLKSGHEAMLEHESITVKFICSRATSHQLVRHRMASFAQESQRYCNYSKDKFSRNVTFVAPRWYDATNYASVVWRLAMENAEQKYFDLLNYGMKPEQAREVLPNSTKTEVVVTANLREWRHILKLRTADDADPEIRALMRDLCMVFQKSIPYVFDDIRGDWNLLAFPED